MILGYEFESKVRQILQSQPSLYAPLEVISYTPTPRVPQSSYRPIAWVTLRWQGKDVSFAAEVKSRTASKLIQETIWELKNYVSNVSERLLILPYLSKSVTEICTKERLSCIDLNGNYLIQTKDLLAIRLDRPNAFKEPQPIKKIFSSNSSMVGRLLLREKKHFSSVNELYKKIIDLGGKLSLSTVSKVLKGLEEELIIEKSSDRIALLQPEKLLEFLKVDYRPPKIFEIQTLKVPMPIINFLRDSIKKRKWVLTGESSAERYGMTTPSTVLSAYVTELEAWPQFEEVRFYNLVLKKVLEPFIYFDISEDYGYWSSKIQSYLELSRLDKREKEIAGIIKEDILREFQ